MSEGLPRGFHFGRRQAQDQVTSSKPVKFSMGMMNASFAVNVTFGTGEKHKKEQKQIRSAPTAIPEHLCEQGWYISPI